MLNLARKIQSFLVSHHIAVDAIGIQPDGDEVYLNFKPGAGFATRYYESWEFQEEFRSLIEECGYEHDMISTLDMYLKPSAPPPEPETKAEEFWLVWNYGGGRPTYRHVTRHSAVTEARRLAKQCIGQRFYVLKTESVSVCEDVDTRPVCDDPAVRNHIDNLSIPF